MWSPLKKTQKNAPLRRRDVARARQKELEGDDIQQYSSFRRSQTLTGSASSSVRTLSEDSAHLRSPRVKSHALTRVRRQLTVIFCGVLVAIAALFVIVSEFTAQVSVTINQEASLAPKAKYEAEVQNYLNNSPLERIRLFMNNANLTDDLRSHFPEVKSATIDGGAGFGVSHLSIVTRQPVAEWTINGQNEYVDGQGVAFRTNYYDDPSVRIVDQSGIRLKEGQTLVSNAFLSFVGQVVGASEQLEHLRVTRITIPPDTTRQIAVSLKGLSYKSILSTDRPAGEQVEDMARAVKWLSRNHQSPKYVDLRVSGEAFYK